MLSLNGCERVSGGAADQLPRDGREEIARAVKPGRVLVFGYSAGKPQHVAVATAHGFVHAIERQGRYDSGVESRGWSQSWTRRLHSVWRFTRWQR